MSELTNEPIHKQTYKQTTQKWTHASMQKWIYGQVDGSVQEQVNEWVTEQLNKEPKQ